jgi:3-phenylpropionate/trans-cinnamate dioxygenase ferredoxin reductase subunit
VTEFVIVGGGLAAASAAVELRERGFDGELHLIAAEQHQPYLRPPLSKGYLLGTEGLEQVFVKPGAWWRDHDVQVLTGRRVTALLEHRVRLDDGRELPFDRALLATGAQPRTLDVAGSGSRGIHTLRTLDDSDRLRAAFAPGGRRVVFVGAGWIGLELAAAARTLGNEVVVVAPGRVPLASAIGDELGGMFAELHVEHGVQLRMGESVVGFESTDGEVSAVLTDRGSIPADLVVVAIGAVPDTALAEAAGLEVDDGVLVDEHLVTSDPDILAAGDLANAYHPVLRQRMRNEHWANAEQGGRTAARSMLGEAAMFDEIPYFYTDQYDLGMEYSGYPPLALNAPVVYRGDRAARAFIAFWMNDDRVVAGMNVNVWDVNEAVQQLIRSGRAVDRDRLADPAIELAAV